MAGFFKKRDKDLEAPSEDKTLKDNLKENSKKKTQKNKSKNHDTNYMDELVGVKNVFMCNSKGHGCIVSEGGYSVIIKYSTADLDLLSNDEQNDFEDGIIQFLMGLTFPVKYRITTEKYDLHEMKHIINSSKVSDTLNIDEYRKNLTREIENIERNSESYIRNKYLVVSSPEYPDDIKRTMNELSSRLRNVLSGISKTGVKYSILNVMECYQYIYNCCHKNSNIKLTDLVENGSFDLYSEGIGTLHNIYIDENEREEYEESFDEVINENRSEIDYELFELERIGTADIISEGTTNILDCLKPDGFEEEECHINMGPRRLARMYSIATLPRSLNIGFFDEFFNQLGLIDLNVYIENIPDNQVIKNLSGEYGKIMSNINAKVKAGELVNYDEEQAAADLDALRQLIQTNEDRMFYSQILFTIWGDSEKELLEKSTHFEDICARKGLMPRVLMNDQKDAFITALPMNRNKFKENLKNITTGGATSLFPVGNTDINHRYGVLYGYNMLSNAIIRYDNFIGQRGSSELSNPHMFVCGKSGTGKSTFQKLKTIRSAMMGHLNIGIDVEGEYEAMTKEFNGNYIVLRPGVKSGLNPFELEVEQDDKGEKVIDVYSKMSEIRTMIATFAINYRHEPLTGDELTGLESALRKLYMEDRGISKEPESLYEDDPHGVGKRKKKLPILSDLKNELYKNEGTKKLAELMELITSDAMMGMFDCETDPNLDVTNPLIVFNIKQLDNFTQLFAMTNILTWIWSTYSNWMYKDYFKTVLIDEGWLFVKDERQECVDFLNLLVRRGRKYKLGLLISSQNIEEFLQSNKGRSVIQMCATKILFRQDSKVANDIAEFFGLSQTARKYITGFQKGECLMVTEQDTLIAKIQLFDEFEAFALT